LKTPGVAIAALAVLGAPALAAEELPPSAGSLSAAERRACADEIRVLQNRRKLFAGQNLPEAELKRRNAAAEEALADCVRELRERRRRDPDLPANPREKLSPEEAAKRERERRQRLDESHRRDPRFMRELLSSVICYQRQKRERAEAGIEEENRFARLGREPDKMALYRYQADLSQASRSLAMARKEIAEYGAPLPCEEEKLAVLAHCLSAQEGDTERDPGCLAEEIQQYLRLLK
jgi:hypothetical protein